MAVSTSKMPPQQSRGLLDVFDQGLGFGAHDFCFGVLGKGEVEEGFGGQYSPPVPEPTPPPPPESGVMATPAAEPDE